MKAGVILRHRDIVISITVNNKKIAVKFVEKNRAAILLFFLSDIIVVYYFL